MKKRAYEDRVTELKNDITMHKQTAHANRRLAVIDGIATAVFTGLSIASGVEHEVTAAALAGGLSVLGVFRGALEFSAMRTAENSANVSRTSLNALQDLIVIHDIDVTKAEWTL